MIAGLILITIASNQRADPRFRFLRRLDGSAEFDCSTDRP